MALIPLDNYPLNESSGIPTNATIWVQFNKTLSSGTVDYLTVSVAAPIDGYVPVEGDIHVRASSNGVADTLLKFIPTPSFDPYKRYGLYIAGTSNGIRAYDGDALNSNLTYYFTTGSGTTENSDAPATGVPEPSSFIPTTNLQVESTNPLDGATNISVSSLYYVEIKFNDPIPTGTNLYDYVKITSKDVI